ncbi:hypothetical protein [Limisalsivibrio acetivorans]|uniref:hypothetical protein n=1 Tax=Limisalsivibrio acetivorans TaxID=1304888 RepID=UPI0003B79F9A|nr:hypothetical protein [Limisalsivibrio acetivorans]
MTVYRVSRRVLFLSGALVLSGLLFSASHALIGLNGAKGAVLAVVNIFIIFNFITLLFRRIEVDGDTVRLFTIYGRKSINLTDLEEIGIIKLKMRIIVILSDPKKFVFISSFYRDFESFVEYVKGRVDKELHESIAKLSEKTIKRKRRILAAVLGTLNLFFLGSVLYNLLNG